MSPLYLALLLILAVAAPAAGQQVVDETFVFDNPNPAYRQGQGPRVCIDEAHHNFHTADVRYKPFADLLRGDGFRVRASTEKFSAEALAECDILVIANALDNEARRHRARPRQTAFSMPEIENLDGWIRSGGALLLTAGHPPYPAAAAILGAVLGVAMVNAETGHGETPAAGIASRDGGELFDHPITRGRTARERIDRIMHFSGHAFLTVDAFAPLIRYGPGSFAYIYREVFANRLELFKFAVSDGWLNAAARRLGRGRVVVLASPAMCSAQLSSRGGNPMGMNHPEAAQNPQFCLNLVRWLAGLLED